MILTLILLTLSAGWYAIQARREAFAASVARTQAVEAQATAIQEAYRAQENELDAFEARAIAVAAVEKAEIQSMLARSAQLALQAELAPETGPQQRILLAIAAIQEVAEVPSADVSSMEQLLRKSLSSPLNIPLRGHSQAIRSLLSSPDGRWLLSLGFDNARTQGQAMLWDLEAGSYRPFLVLDDENPTAAAISSGSAFVAVSTSNGVKLWNTKELGQEPDGTDRSSDGNIYEEEKFDPAHEIPHEPAIGSIQNLIFHPHGWHLSIAGTAGLMTWNIARRSQSMLITDTTPLAVSVDPSGEFLVSNSVEAVKLWDLTGTSHAPATLISYPFTATEGISGTAALAFSSTEPQLAAADSSGTIRIWNTNKLSDEPTLYDGPASPTKIAFHPDGDKFASVGGNTIYLWNQGESVPMRLKCESEITDFAFSPDGRWLVAADPPLQAPTYGVTLLSRKQQGPICLWDLQKPDADPIQWFDDGNAPTVVTFIPPSGEWLASGYSDGSIRLRQLPWIEDYVAEPSIWNPDGMDQLTWVTVSPDGNTLAVGDYKGVVKLLAANDPDQELIHFEGHTGEITGLAFSPDSRRLASSSFDNTVRIWSTSTGEEIKVLDHLNGIWSVGVSPKGHWLATAAVDGLIRLWETVNYTPIEPPLAGYTDQLTAIAFSPNDRWLATTSHGSEPYGIQIWDIEDLEAAPFLSEDGYSWVSFSPDNLWIAAPSTAGGVKLWHTDDPTAESPLLQADIIPYVITFSPDGDSLLAAGQDGRALVWDMQNLQANPARLPGHTGAFITAVDFTPKGQWIAAAIDGTLRFWTVNLDLLVEKACHHAGRNFIYPEWSQYFDPQDTKSVRTCPMFPVHDSITKTLIVQAEQRARDGNISDAVTQFEQALAIDPNLEIAPQADTQRISNTTKAQRLVEEGGWLADEGDVGRAIDKFEEALKLDESLELEPEEEAEQRATSALVSQGNVLNSHGDIDGAIAKFKEALALDPSLAEAKRSITSILIEQGETLANEGEIEGATLKFEEALAFDTTLELEPEQEAKQLAALSVVEEGRTLAQIGEVISATLKFEEALLLNPSLDMNPDAEINSIVISVLWKQADSLAKEGKADEAVLKFEEIQAIDPSQVQLSQEELEQRIKGIAALGLVDQGYDLAYQGDVEGAITKFEKALALDPSREIEPERWAKERRASALVYQGESLAREGDVEGAVDKFEEALVLNNSWQIEPKQYANQLAASALIARGDTLAAEGEFEQAIAAYKEALALDSSLEMVPEQKAWQIRASELTSQGDSLVFNGDVDKAIAKYEEALQLDDSLGIVPEHDAKYFVASMLAKQGDLLAKKGEFEQAIVKYEDALALDSSLEIVPEEKAWQIRASYLVEQGTAQAHEGAVDGAIAKFKEALALDPFLEIAPEQEAKRLAAPSIVEEGRMFAQRGEVVSATLKLEEAGAIAEDLQWSALSLAICRLREIDSVADTAIGFCDEVIDPTPRITPGQPVTGTVSNLFGDLWALDITASSRVTITLARPDVWGLDTYLILYNADFQILAEHDDIENGVIQNSELVDLPLTESGIYLINASRCCPNDDQGSVGKYILEVAVTEGK